MSGDYRRAAEAYSMLAASNPGNPELLSNAGVMWHLGGDDARAVQSLRRALALNPNLAAANLFQGLSLVRMGRANESISFLMKAYRADSQGILPVLGLARAYVALRDYGRASNFYHNAAGRDSANAEAWFGLGITYRHLLDSAAARLARLDPDASPAVLDNAARCDTAGLRPASNDTRVLARVVSCYERLSLAALAKAAELDPGSPRTRLLLGESLRDAGRINEAVPEYEAAIRIQPSLPAWLGLAVTYWKSGGLENALPPLRKALELAPDDADANELMADILVRLGEYAEAQRYVDRALHANPHLVRVWWAQAKIHMAQDKPGLAEREIRKALPADADGTCYFLLHEALRKLGREEEAREALKQFQRRRARARGTPPKTASLLPTP